MPCDSESEIENGSTDMSSVDQTCSCTDLIRETLKTLHAKIQNIETNDEFLVCKTAIYVCEQLLSVGYLDMQNATTYMSTLRDDLLSKIQDISSISITSQMSNASLRGRMCKHIPDQTFTVVTSKQYGTLFIRKDLDTNSALQETLFQFAKCRKENDMLREKNEQLRQNLAFGQPVDTQQDKMIQIATCLRNKLDMIINNLSKLSTDVDLKHLQLNQILEATDPQLFNFLFCLVASKDEFTQFLKFSGEMHFTDFKRDDSFPKHTKFLRILFLVSQLAFIRTDGDATFPFHFVLSDAIQACGGSAKLVQLLNRFGVLSSFDKCQREVGKIMKDRSEIDIVNEHLIPDGFVICSVDNVDFDQPHTRLYATPKSRGIHMTSLQAVQPKPNLIKNFQCEKPSTCTKTDHSFSLPQQGSSIPSDAFEGITAEQVTHLTELESTQVSEFRKNVFFFIVRQYVNNSGHLSASNLKLFLKDTCNITPSTEKGAVVYLNVFNQPCDNIETLRTVAETIFDKFKIGQDIKNLILVGDGKTYDLLVKLKSQYWEELSWLIIFPGDWHLLKNLQPVLFKIYLEAGMKEVAKENFKEEGLLNNLITCHHFKRTHQFLLCFFEALYIHQLEMFAAECDEHSEVADILQRALEIFTNAEQNDEVVSIQKLKTQVDTLFENFQQFQTNCSSDKTFHFWNNCLHRDLLAYVMLYIAMRTNNWPLRVASLKLIAPLFHAFDRPLYLRLVPRHLSDLLVMPSSILEHLAAGGFSVTITGREDSHLALDEAHESYINLDLKTHCTKPSSTSVQNLASYLPYRAGYLQNLHNLTKPATAIQKQHMSKSVLIENEKIMRLYLGKIRQSDVFKFKTDRSLEQLFSRKLADTAQSSDLMSFYEIGNVALNDFIKNRILNKPSASAPVHKKQLRTFATKQNVTKTISKNDKDQKTFQMCLKRKIEDSMKSGQPIGTIEQFIPLPRAIANPDSSMYHQDSKSNATRAFKKRYMEESVFSPTLPENWAPEVVILEGMFIINAAPIRSHHKTFKDYIMYVARRWILPHLKSKDCLGVHVLFDDPGAMGSPSLKDIERARRDQDRCDTSTCDVQLDCTLPPAWRDFLNNRSNKRQLIQLLCTTLPSVVQPHLQGHQYLIVAGGFLHADRGKALHVTATSSPCFKEEFTANHEETDTLIWSHVASVPYQKVFIFSPDTDVYHIGLCFLSSYPHKQVFIQINMIGHENEYLNLNNLHSAINRDPDLVSIPIEARCRVIQLIYITSGCDYLSFWVGHGKSGFLACLFQHAEFISSGRYVPGCLAENSFDLSLLAFYRLIGSLYFKQCRSAFSNYSGPFDMFKDFTPHDESTDILESHKSWLTKIRNTAKLRSHGGEEHCMPSASALRYHWLRTKYIASIMADSAYTKLPYSPGQLSLHGYRIEGTKVSVVWDDDKYMAEVTSNTEMLLCGCKCKKGCRTKNCKCLKAGIKCGASCSCIGCVNCSSQEKVALEDVPEDCEQDDAPLQNDLLLTMVDEIECEYVMQQEDFPEYDEPPLENV